MRISDFLKNGKKPVTPSPLQSQPPAPRPPLASSKPKVPPSPRGKAGDLGIEWIKAKPQQVKDYRPILTAEDLKAYLLRCQETKLFSFDWETAADNKAVCDWLSYEEAYNESRYWASQVAEDVRSEGWEPAVEGTATQIKAENKRRETAFKKRLREAEDQLDVIHTDFKSRRKEYLKLPLDPHHGEICTVSISAAPHEARVIPISHKHGRVFEPDLNRTQARQLILDLLDQYVLHKKDVVKIAVNLAFETKYLAKYGRYLTGLVADPLIQWVRVLQVAFPQKVKDIKEPARGWGLKPATEEVFGVKMTEFQETLDKYGVDFFDQIPADSGDGLNYSAEDADYGLQHYLYWQQYVVQIPMYDRWLHEIEMPFARVVGLMEYHGMNWDNATAEMRRQEANAAQDRAITELKRIAKEACGLDVDPGKTGKNMAMKFLLFEHMRLPLAKATEKGGIGMDKEALLDIEFMLKNKLHDLSEEQFLAAELPDGWEEIEVPGGYGSQYPEENYREFHALDRGQRMKLEILKRDPHPYQEAGLALIEQMRIIQKNTTLLSSHVDGREKYQNGRSGRIHPNYSPWTETSRLKSSNPNGQNVPNVHNDSLGVRNMFKAPDGRIMFLIDFAGFELRILAWKSGDEVMIDIFKNDGDIHRTTAAAIAGKAPEDVTKQERKDAKPANFGIAYGGTEHALQLVIKKDYDKRLTLDECATMIAGVNKAYKRIKEYQRDVVIEAREKGFVQTIYGYIRMLPGLNSANRYDRSQDERKAINTPIQGTAADVMKRAQNDVYDAIAAGTSFWSRVEAEGADAQDEAEAKQFPLAHGRTDMIAQIHDEIIFEMDDDPDVVEAAWKVIEAAMTKAPIEGFPVPVLADASVAYRWGEKMPVEQWLKEKRGEAK